ncbi:MAG: hypothetical protein BWY45_02360 [Euryarchaeota archaeon ADurb.Bin294]|jgi:ubiquinone/menaquinone biosynthesis C-methylase UbiE|uniref:class I SAM-dependent methyltransferase n=1 Tax=Methanospirillum sp. TaxID=45200 RepID=UPI0009C592DA|nr:MAG: hypothetical protein BWY45_02360 [Euryarchaeota archaeon ADurb.Bin294]
MNRAQNPGLDGRIVTWQAQMDNLPFDEQSFDIVWAEGSAFLTKQPTLFYEGFE